MNIGIPVKLFRPMTCLPHFQFPSLMATSLIAIIKYVTVLLSVTSHIIGKAALNPSCFTAIVTAACYSDCKCYVLA